MAVNKRLLQGAAAAPGGITPSEHFGVVLYEGDNSSSHSINGGKFGAAFYGNGSNSYIDFGDNIFKFDEFSVSFWVNVSSFVNNQVIYNHYDEIPSQSAGSLVRTNSSGNILVDCWTPPSTYGGNVTSTSTLSANTWYHIGITLTQSQVKIYINGSLDKTGSISGFGYHSTHNFGLGAYLRTGSSPSSFFNGKIDQFRMFQKALSSSEVSTLYAETASTVESLDPLSEDTTDTLQVLGDSSCVAAYRFENNEDDESGNFDGTGTAVQYGAGRYGQSLQCNNSSTKVVIGAENSVIPNNTTGVSFSFWVNLDTINTGSDYDHWFVGQEDYGGSFGDGEFSVRLYEGKVYTDYAQSSSIYRQRKATTVLSTGQWYHIVATYDTSNSNITEVYLNGVLETSTNITSGGTFTTTALMQNSSNISIGGGPTFTDGKIDQFRIFTKVLSASEVTTLYNENSLVASYRFEGNANDDTRNYDGTASNVTYEYGLGFTPDFVWIKDRDNAEQHILNDSTRGATKDLSTDRTNAEATRTAGFLSFDDGGFTLGSDPSGVVNDSTRGPYVAWCLKANGGTTSSNTDGSATSTVQANTDAGFSIVTFNHAVTSTTYSYGHGLGVKPDIIILKMRNGASNWFVYYSGFGATKKLELNQTIAESSTGAWASTEPTTSVFSVNNVNAGDWVAYLFHSVDGFSKFGSYTGTSADGNIVETGFEPALIIIKKTSAASGSWWMLDNRRNPTNPRNTRLVADQNYADSTGTNGNVNFFSNGFELLGNYQGTNESGQTYIYMAFAADPDTEAPTVAKSFAVQTYSGNSSTQTLDGFGFKPSMIWFKGRTVAYDHGLYDSVRGGDSLIYPSLSQAASTVTNGIFSFDDDGVTFGANNKQNSSDSTYVAWAWKADDNEPTLFGGNARAVYKFEDNANDVTGNHNATAYNISYVTGKFNKAADFNGSSSYINTSLTISNWVSNLNSRSVDFTISLWANVDSVVGGDNTFLYIGNYNAYSPNYNAMIIDYRSTGSKIRFTHSSTYVESTSTISLDTWYHIVCVRESGVIKLYINGVLENSATPSADMQISSSAVATLGALYFSSTTHGELDGMLDQFRFYSGAVSDIGVAALYAETTSDNDDLSLAAPKETIISANANAGFSIVKFQANSTNAAPFKVPHGLSAAPDLIIVKDLDNAVGWHVYSSALSTPSQSYLQLNSSAAALTGNTNIWDNTAATSTVFSMKSGYAVTAGANCIAYCFHSVSGYSKFGTYSGSGSSVSVNTGFQADWVMIKRIDASTHFWNIFDSVRGGDKRLYPNSSNAETDESSDYVTFDSDGFNVDITSNGDLNTSGGTYIYAAFKIN